LLLGLRVEGLLEVSFPESGFCSLLAIVHTTAQNATSARTLLALKIAIGGTARFARIDPLPRVADFNVELH